MPLFLMGCFPVDFQEVKRPLRTKSAKSPIKVGKRPINEGKRPMKDMVLVGILVGCLMGCFRSPPPWRKTAPLKRPIKRSMISVTKIASQNRNDHGGCKPARKHPAAEIAGFVASPAAKKSLAPSDFWGWSQNRSDHGRKSAPGALSLTTHNPLINGVHFRPLN